jgi:hypothetical protein
MALTQVETSGLSGSGASSNSTTGNVFSQTGPFKNRIINGDMRIDQRNAGASVTVSTSNEYTLDRWQAGATASSKFTVQQNAGSVTPPAGFTNYLGCTSSAATSLAAGDYYLVQQKVEGFNVSDLAWGTANASSVTLSFWVRSSLTGTFGGAIQNSAGNRSYPFTYSISSANTWEKKAITISGDTSGTWLTTNGIGLYLLFGIGVGSTFSGTAGAWAGSNFLSATGATSVVGTNGATFYITGVQLEVGTSATQFERRSYGQELALCQRYCVLLDSSGGEDSAGAGIWFATTAAIYQMRFPVEMRAQPSLTNVSPTVAMYIPGGTLSSNSPTINTSSTSGVEFYTVVSSGSTTLGYGTSVRYTAGKSLLTAEL